MERASLVRWLLIGAAVFLFMQYGLPLFTGEKGGDVEKQPYNLVETTSPAERIDETTCKLKGNRFEVELTSKGAALKHAWMTDDKYTKTVSGEGAQEQIDLVTTWRQAVMPLRTNFRVPCAQEGDKCVAIDQADQVAYDDFDWKIASQTDKTCVFVYEDDQVALEKSIAVTERAFELDVLVKVTNKHAEPQRHRLTVEQTAWRTQEETEGSMGRTAEWATRVEANAGGETVRFEPSDFEPDEFEDEDFTEEKWRRAPGEAGFASVSSSYFSKAVFHLDGPNAPFAEMQIEHVWDEGKFKDPSKDPDNGHIYRSRLAYPIHELGSGETAEYKVAAYVGPKEREVLASVAGGNVDAMELLDLGVFGVIGKLLIRYLYILYGFTKTWGWAICLLTITVKVLLFPLSISQIKSSMAMRKLKPQMDELNKKYKDDATQRGVALQELWRKNNVTNPMLGCLPVLFQMPVWFALYTALQTAVELYHTPFGPFIPDLSAPGLYYIIPVALGCSSLLQQHLMPMQGDAMQQKLMKWMMPAMFTVFMLFLPAGLGIYFLTNTWLGIGQQLVVERYYKSQETKDDPAAAGEDDDAEEEESSSKASTKKKKGGPSAKRAKAETA